MTDVFVAFKRPDNGEREPGTIRFQLKPLPNAHPFVEGPDIIITRGVPYEVPETGATIDLKPTPFGWYYAVQGTTESGWRLNTNVYVPDEGQYEFEQLVTLDPSVPFSFERPEPLWWQSLNQLTDLYAEGYTDAANRAESAQAAAEDSAEAASLSEAAAEAAQSGAESAQAGAEAARDTAVSSAESAQSDRTRAEAAADSAEADRVTVTNARDEVQANTDQVETWTAENATYADTASSAADSASASAQSAESSAGSASSDAAEIQTRLEQITQDDFILATDTDSGLMYSGDKAKLDAATASASANSLVQRDSTGRFDVAIPTSATHAARKDYVDSAVSQTIKDYGSLLEADLDEIIEPGEYLQGSSSNATVERNYPGSQIAGQLSVRRWGGGYISSNARLQTYTEHQGRRFWRLSTGGGVWSDWMEVANTDLATDTTRGLMSSDDKVKSDTGHVNVFNYGARGDGSADDTSSLQAAIDDADGRAVFMPPGEYLISDTLKLGSGSTLRGSGKGVTVINMQPMNAEISSSKTAIQSVGTIDSTSHGITSDVNRGSKVVTVENASSNYSAGDRVLLQSDDIFHSTSSLRVGEIKVVESVSSDEVIFEDAAYDNYISTSAARLQKLDPVFNVTLENFTLKGTETDNMERGFYAYVSENVKVVSCEFLHTDWNSVNLRHVVNFRVDDNTFRNVEWVNDTSNYYGLTVENATAHGVFRGNHGTLCRHLFTTGYTVGQPGVTRFIVVANNTDMYSQSSSYDSHNGSEYLTIKGNMSSYSTAHGINVRAPHTTISDNVILNYSHYGIHVREGADSCIINGNRVRSDVEGAATAVFIRKTLDHTPQRVSVTDNIIETVGANSIYVIDVDKVTIANNTFASVHSSYTLRLHNSENPRVMGNRSEGGSAFTFLQDCKGAIISNNSAGANTYGVRMNETESGKQQDTVIIGNDFSEVTNSNVVLNLLGKYRIIGNLGLDDYDSETQ